jgi:acyl dehydratase
MGACPPAGPELAEVPVFSMKWRFEVTKADILRFCLACDESDPIHLDSKAAQAAGYRDALAPTLFYTVVRLAGTNMVPKSAIAHDGVPIVLLPHGIELDGVTPVGGTMSAEFGAEMCAGDQIDVVSAVVGVRERQGRRGPKSEVDVETTLHNQFGEWVATELYTYVYEARPS